MNVTLGAIKKIFNVYYTYWGFSQWYKFRWNKTHIDLGIISFYNLPQSSIGQLFWRLVSILIKPLRMWYHYRFVYSIKGQISSMETEANICPDENGIIQGTISNKRK